MKSLRLSFLSLFLFGITLSAAQETYKQISITVPNVETLNRIWSAGIDHEGAGGKIGGVMKFIAGDFELRKLSRNGISYAVEIADLSKFYEQRNAATPCATNPMGFGYGSMGGFYTLAEVITQLDSMRLLYPNLISARDSIGVSNQNRAIWMTKIGSAQSAGKPEALYTALHHAREPQGMMAVLYYMWWLLQNYGTNAEATYLVNNRQMYFIPVVNPDGYEYNRQTTPNGGGMWRKNRKDNGGGVFGVDLNRNYGTFEMWNSPNGGSSTSPSSDTYRGTAPFSEPELQTIDRFMRAHQIRTCYNYHTYGNYLIYPFGYLSRENADSIVFRDWAHSITATNRYTNGTDQQTVNYSTRGNSDDYMFGDTTKTRTWAMTPEVGTSGFWPSQAEIFPLAIENLQQNKFLAYFAGHYTTVVASSIQDGGNANGFLNRGESFSLVTRVKNKGVSIGASVSFLAASSNPSVQFSSTAVVLGSVQPFTEYTVNLNGTVATNATEGVPVKFFVRISDPDGFEKIDTLDYFVGTPTTIFSDDASGGTTNWNTGTGWGITSSNHTPPSAFTDSPSGTYLANANNSLALNNALSLNTYNFAELKFWTKWALEPTWDFATVEISSNNGTTWTTLRTKLSQRGSARSGSKQTTGTWGYDGYTSGLTWVEQAVDLTSYVNQSVKIRFRVQGDSGDNRDGFYVDDVRVDGYTTSAAPLDTGLVIRRPSFTFNGNIGRLWIDSTIIKNATSAPMTISVAESSLTSDSFEKPIVAGKNFDLRSLIERVKPAIQRANLTPSSFVGSTSPLEHPSVYTTILTDDRSENGAGAADIYRAQYQFRITPLSSFHDFRFVLGNLPDTNVAIILSVDTDQKFQTGRFPTPLGAGPTSRDVGSEREIILDASGIIIDSLTGLGRIPAGLVLDVSQDSIQLVGIPFLLNVQRDSVLTIGTETGFGGINITALNDPDRKMNLGFMAVRLTRTNPLPDYAPQIGHANVGGETGVSWLTEQQTSFTLAANESTYFRIGALGAKPAGTHRAQFVLNSVGRQPVTIPVAMNLTTAPNPVINVSPTEFRDSLMLGDSLINTFTIRNTGGGALNYVVLDTAGVSWMTINPLIGTLDSGQTATVSLLIRSAGLRTDTTYGALIAVISNDPARNTVPIVVTLRVKRVTSVNGGEQIPTEFALYQNYPNPFNPTTKIEFQIPSGTGQVPSLLKLYDVLGREVAVLKSEVLEPGTHAVTLDGSNLSSGVYYYKLDAGSFSATRKLLLMK